MAIIKDPESFLGRTQSPEGELELLKEASEGSDVGKEWMDMVRLGLMGDALFAELADRPLVKRLSKMAEGVLVPRFDNFKPEEDAPWGGTRIVTEVKKGLEKWKDGLVVGESWEISGHPSFPNLFPFEYEGINAEASMGVFEVLFPEKIFGGTAATPSVGEMPYLVKFLNSGSWLKYKSKLSIILAALDKDGDAREWRKALGVNESLVELGYRDYDKLHHGISKLEALMGDDHKEKVQLSELHHQMLTKNLSVQVHPTSDYEGLGPGEHSKTEAWIVVDAEPGAGIYLGLKEGVTKSEFEAALTRGEDVTIFLNFVEVTAGEVFFIPSGTIHAIGAGVLLVEPQETSETTYRVYDYGRTDDEGNPRQLHVKDAIAATEWGGVRGKAAIEVYRRKPVEIGDPGNIGMPPPVFQLVDEDLFQSKRIELSGNSTYHPAGILGVRGYTVLEGEVEISPIMMPGDPRPERVKVRKGQSFVVPAAAGTMAIFGVDNKPFARAVVIETSQPAEDR